MMNKHIEELLTKCNYLTDGTCDLSREIRLAELIIQECANLVDNTKPLTAAETYDDVIVARYEMREHCAKLICQRFGVER
jgi:hypothetical protein